MYVCVYVYVCTCQTITCAQPSIYAYMPPWFQPLHLYAHTHTHTHTHTYTCAYTCQATSCALFDFSPCIYMHTHTHTHTHTCTCQATSCALLDFSPCIQPNIFELCHETCSQPAGVRPLSIIISVTASPPPMCNPFESRCTSRWRTLRVCVMMYCSRWASIWKNMERGPRVSDMCLAAIWIWVCVCACMYVVVCVCMYVCMYVCI